MSLDIPSDAGESLPARQPYLFHPTAGETYPSRLQVFSSHLMSARASRPPNLPFHLHLSDTASLISRWTPARALPTRQPYLSNLLLDEAYPSDTAIIEATVGRRQEPPGQTTLPFQTSCSTRLTRPTRRLLKPPSDVGENLPDRQTYLFHPAAGKAYPTTLPVDCEAFRPLNFTLLSKPIQQVHARRGLPI